MSVMHVDRTNRLAFPYVNINEQTINNLFSLGANDGVSVISVQTSADIDEFPSVNGMSHQQGKTFLVVTFESPDTIDGIYKAIDAIVNVVRPLVSGGIQWQ